MRLQLIIGLMFVFLEAIAQKMVISNNTNSYINTNIFIKSPVTLSEKLNHNLESTISMPIFNRLNNKEIFNRFENPPAHAHNTVLNFKSKRSNLVLPCSALITLPLDDASAVLINAGNKKYSAQKIEANNSEITGSTKVVFSAEKSVTLLPGFKAGNQAVFTSQIANCSNNNPPATTMYIQGRDLFDANHQKFVPVGINYPTDYWQFSGANEYINQVDFSGANMARIVWFQNSVAGTSHTDADLNTLITKFASKKITPVVTLWDGYVNDPNQLNKPNGYVSWWTDPVRVNMLNTHKKYLIINIINELGFGRGFAYDPNLPSDVAAFTNWKNQYKTAINNIRNAGLDVPLMIDAPLGGTSLKVMNLAAAELLAYDPKHNLIFSIHAYWAEENQTNELNTAINNNLPLIFGELANRQLGADNWNTNPATGYSECYYGLDGTAEEHMAPSGYNYKNLLPLLKSNGIGWLGWEWLNDGCTDRNLTTNGSFTNLTPFGNDLINNVNYGMKNIAIKSNAF